MKTTSSEMSQVTGYPSDAHLPSQALFSLPGTDQPFPRRLSSHPHAKFYNPENCLVSRRRQVWSGDKFTLPSCLRFPMCPLPSLLHSIQNDALAQPKKPYNVVPRRVMRKLRVLLKYIGCKTRSPCGLRESQDEASEMRGRGRL
jgi:hypothetical protein